MVDVQGSRVRARIVHTGRGRYKIEEDATGEFGGRVVDASDILSCDVDRLSPPM